LCGLLVLKGTRRLCHSHRLVSAPLERRGSSGIDVAGLEPPLSPETPPSVRPVRKGWDGEVQSGETVGTGSR